MRRITAGICLVAGVVSSGVPPALSEDALQAESALIDQASLPDAIDSKGARPKADPSVLAPAVDALPPSLESLAAPPPLALPDDPVQVRIHELRPLFFEEALQLAEFNSPQLKAAASQVDQAKSALRAAISAWYPKVDLSASGLPEYFESYSYRNPDFALEGANERYSREWKVNGGLKVSWDLIDPARVPQIALARDQFERAGDSYLIALRDLRLAAATAYFDLQEADERVRIGQDSVKASLVSYRDARARFNAGVNTKLQVLEAETQLARDRNLLTDNLGRQNVSRRNLAEILSLPQDVTPTAASPARPLGLWESSLHDSIIAAYNFREELDQLILDISINNSKANVSLAAVQPTLGFLNSTTVSRSEGQSNQTSSDIDMGDFTYGVQNSAALTTTWRLFDGGRAQAEYRRSKQAADESRLKFARTRNQIRREVEQSFFDLRSAIQSIDTTASEVLSSRESLRLAQLRVQAGVSTQREVVDTQRDLTTAQIRYAGAIRDYNTNLAQLQRRTGLDALIACNAVSLTGIKPESDQEIIPIEPTPLKTACPSLTTDGSSVDQTEGSPVQPLW